MGLSCVGYIYVSLSAASGGNWLLVAVVAAVAVGLLVLGMSITLILKGHHIRSEIADNPEMRRRGIQCAAEQMRAQDRVGDSSGCLPGGGCSSGECAGCGHADSRD